MGSQDSVVGDRADWSVPSFAEVLTGDANSITLLIDGVLDITRRRRDMPPSLFPHAVVTLGQAASSPGIDARELKLPLLLTPGSPRKLWQAGMI